ncbi:uncharacterized protein CCOS01_15300 [Colletotrichum costaricense]|uniref:Uncharacterized protein n=1 Tax=Colletotrichum costaricense TaxID=1209916 RepID=A0AAI9YHN1_9PEZI|nr:uncharacterized protein CCOS01_15300 [Colletotrichum costaricense]KAK1510469.1 hypothetical protein CCOS01_15300 [Colletotrichum costaricense]
MFRLATAPTRTSGVRRHLLACIPTPPSLPCAPAAPSPPPPTTMPTTTTRTLKTKSKLRPLPGLKKSSAREEKPKPRDVVFEPRSLTEFKILLRELAYMSVTAERAHDVYMKYMKALARPDKPQDWQKAFVKENNITAGELHETAGLLYFTNTSSESELILQFNMMETAAGLGYDPAALTLGRHLYRAEGKKNYYDWDNPRWHHTRTRCLALIAEGRDANAMVLAGLRHLNRETERDNYLALEAFTQALALGKDAAYFDWMCSALEGQGDAYLRLGEKDKAKDTFFHLGKLGYARGWSRLADLYPDDKGTMGWLFKAAGAGLPGSYQKLVDHCEKWRKFCAPDEKWAAYWERHASEWTRILKASIARKKLNKSK